MKDKILGSEVILNFLSITKGGGLQNSLSFLATLGDSGKDLKAYIVIVQTGSELERMAGELGIKYLAVPVGKQARLRFELLSRRLFRKGQLCFSIFGQPWLGSRGYLINLCGFAYSNLLYPEIDFWGHLSPMQKIVKAFVDKGRKWGVGGADYWIFESEILRKRAVEMAGFPQDRTSVVRMAASKLVSPDMVKTPEWLSELDQNKFKLLFLHGGHPNKRQHVLPDIAGRLLALGLDDFLFLLTMDEHSSYSDSVMTEVRDRGLESVVRNLGPVDPLMVATLIDRVQCMCSFSRLESFSNNYVEAWQMSRPLVVGDGDWARDCCGEGAMYVNPDDVEGTAAAIAELVRDADLRERLVSGGQNALGRHPNSAEKNELYFRVIETAKELGHCPVEERRAIQWP